ncbi:MAG: phycobiliprotein lyase [Prochlorococcaceae cyanobacterium]
MSDTHSEAESFPPQEIGAFLRFCAGEWMTLRSRFELSEDSEGENGDEWHSSDRGELLVTYLEPERAGCPGGLRLCPKGQSERQLVFAGDGSFAVNGAQGQWQLWPDGSLELSLGGGDSEVRERIWFTKPNLRLRSTVESRGDGSPGRASFSSEIRRVSRPAPAAS